MGQPLSGVDFRAVPDLVRNKKRNGNQYDKLCNTSR